MTRKLVIQYGGDPTIIEEIPGEGINRLRGTTVPTDGATGYAKGCQFTKTDGSTGTTLYLNEGSNTSCDFNSLN